MIWLIGNKGMLGSAVELKLRIAGMKFSATDMDVDITSANSLNNHAASIFKPDEKNWIINCSAYTAVDKAEDEPELASKLNIDGVKNIVECAKKFNAVLIHISTDYVFDGKNPAPLTEDMKPAPVSVYGKTKLAGESALKNEISEYFIIRTAWLYGVNGSNFVYTMLKLMNAHDSIKVVNDQHGSPTNAEDLAGLIINIVSSNSDHYGTYHYSNEGNITWFDFAAEIFKLGREAGLITSECEVKPCSSEQFPTKAKRPEYSLLSKIKVKETFSIEVPEWQDSLASYLNLLRPIVIRARQWKDLALEDYDSAEYMFKGGRYSYVFFMCQQAVEKATKAVIEFYSLPQKTHNLMKLALSAKISLNEKEETLFMKLFRNYTRMRYPDLNRFKPEREETEKIFKETGEFLWKIKTNPMFSIL